MLAFYLTEPVLNHDYLCVVMSRVYYFKILLQTNLKSNSTSNLLHKQIFLKTEKENNISLN